MTDPAKTQKASGGAAALPASTSPEPTSAAAVASGLVSVTVATIGGNLVSYALLLVAARTIAAAEYSELVTLLNLMLIAFVPTLAIQAVAARRIATGSRAALLQGTGVVAGVGALLLVALAPLESSFLHLPTLVGPLLVAATLPAAALQGYCQGVWQGRQRFKPLAVTIAAGTVGRSGAGLIGLVVGKTSLMTVGFLAAGVWLAALGCLAHLRRSEAGIVSLTPADRRSVLSVLAECAHATHAYAVFLLLSATDVLLARHLLPSAELAAAYAAGSVLTRITLWLPQAVTNVLFASLTDQRRHREIFLRAGASLVGLCAFGVLGTFVLSSLATQVVGGSRYNALRHDIWLFAVIGGSLAILQFALVAGLAVRNRIMVALVWLTIATDGIAVMGFSGHQSVRGIAGTVAVITALAASAALIVRTAKVSGFRTE